MFRTLFLTKHFFVLLREEVEKSQSRNPLRGFTLWNTSYKKTHFFRALPKKKGGGMALPEFFGPFSLSYSSLIVSVIRVKTSFLTFHGFGIVMITRLVTSPGEKTPQIPLFRNLCASHARTGIFSHLPK